MTKSSLGQGTLEPNPRVFHLGAALEQLFQDVRFGLRLLRREPGFAATTVLLFGIAPTDSHYTGRGLRPAAARRGIRCLAAGAARRPRRSARCASYRIGSPD